MNHTRIALGLGTLFALPLFAANEYIITWVSPPTKIVNETNIRIDFSDPSAGALSPTADDTVTLLYGSQNGGGNPANYPFYATLAFRVDTSRLNPLKKDTLFMWDSVVAQMADSVRDKDSNTTDAMYTPSRVASGSTLRRSIMFSPRFQSNMSSGRFYFIIKNEDGTKVSNEAFIIVESRVGADLLNPKGDLQTPQPMFQWSQVVGVPYYHLLLSDQPIELTDKGIQDASFIWQAITPGTQIQYGTPDPAGLFPAPPPLTTGTSYQWVVLNNYGNKKEYTSLSAFSIPATFTLKKEISFNAPDTSTMKTVANGVPLKSFYDTSGLASYDTTGADSIVFSWGRVTDSSFNLYKVYLYNVVYDSNTKSNAAISIWTRNTIDTFVTLEAKYFLADSVIHEWKVFAENKEGAGVASAKKAFLYNDTTQTGTIEYHAREIQAGDTVPVKFAEATVTPLSGGGIPIDLPTNHEGNGEKTVPLGSYRVTLKPKGYLPQSREVTLTAGNRLATLDYYLEKYPCQVFGAVKDSGTPVPDAVVLAVSEFGDTLVDSTDNTGSFGIYLPEGDWVVYADKPGYKRSTEYTVELAAGDAKPLGTVNISRYDFVISGTVSNSETKKSIINAVVTLSRNGIFLETDRTDSSGVYGFSVEQGTGYALQISREGFATVIKSNITVATNVNVNISLSSETGTIQGLTRVTSHVLSPTTSQFVQSRRKGVLAAALTMQGDTAGVVESDRDAFYSFSLPADTYAVWFSGENLIPFGDTVIVKVDTTTPLDLNLREFAKVSGRVFALDTLGSNRKVNVTARDTLTGSVSNFSTSEATADYAVLNLVKGVYALTFAADGFAPRLDTVAVRDTVISGTAYLLSALTGDDTLAAGSIQVRWAVTVLGAPLPASDSATQVKVKFPLQKSFKAYQVMDKVGAGLLVFGTNAAPDSVIDLDSLAFTVTVDDTVTLAHPFKHRAAALADTTGMTQDSVKLTLLSASAPDSAFAFYRDQSENAYQRVAGTVSATGAVFRLLPTLDNSQMKYYFVAHTGGAKYSNKNEVFSTSVPPSPRIKYVTLLPTALDASAPAILPWGAIAEFKVLTQNGSFVPVAPDSIVWTAANRTGVTFGNKNSPVMMADISKNVNLDTAFVDTISCRVVHAASGLDQTVRTYVSVVKLSVDTVRIIGQTNEIYAGGKASFQVEGYNRAQNRSFPAAGVWTSTPPLSSPFGIDQSGRFSSPTRFLGAFDISATAFGKSASTRLFVKHLAASRANTYADNRSDVFVAIDSLAFTGNPQDLLLSATAKSAVPLLKAVTKEGQVISPLYNLNFGKATAAEPEDFIGIYFQIPDEYQGKEGLYLAKWNLRTTSWDKKDSVTEVSAAPAGSNLPPGKKLLFKTRKLRESDKDVPEFAILAASLKLGIHNLKVGPNPFSPFVTARDSAGRTWPGLRVEFETGSSKSAQVWSEVQVFNIEGNVVRDLTSLTPTGSGFARLYSLTTSGGFNGNKTLVRTYLWDGTNKNGRLCRNGRYFVKIFADDGVDKKFKTVPVVLFK